MRQLDLEGGWAPRTDWQRERLGIEGGLSKDIARAPRLPILGGILARAVLARAVLACAVLACAVAFPWLAAAQSALSPERPPVLSGFSDTAE